MARERDWTSFDARPLRMVVLGAITGLSLVVVVYLMTEVRDKLNDLASSPADSVQWTLSQLEVEFLEFSIAVDRASALTTDSDKIQRTIALAELRKRYDILYSRYETLSTSPLYATALFSERIDGRFENSDRAIKAMVPWIDGTDAALFAAIPQIWTELETLRPDVRAILTIGNQELVADSDRARQDAGNVLYRLAFFTFILLVMLSMFVFIFRHLANVNERRAREIQKTSSRLATIVSTSRDALLVLNRRGKIETANEAAEAMFGHTRAAMTGQSVGTLLKQDVSDHRRPINASDLRALHATPGATGHRLIGQHLDDTSFPVELSLDVTDREGAEVSVCVIRDISHQILAEAELKESRDRALAGERAKARFLGIVSHEMRTPLNGIIGTIDLMHDEPEGEIRKRFVPVLRQSAQLLLDLVNDVLDITQIEGRTNLESDDFNFDDLVGAILDAEKPRAKANGNRLVRIDEPAIGTVTGDQRRIRQILLNLVSNAVKFTHDGEVTISVERLDAHMIEIQVADTGLGIPEDQIDHIFDDFVRLDSAVSRQIQGTGLGLGIARQLARRMDGDISVESIAGEGSLFCVTLPLPKVDTPDAPVVTATVDSPPVSSDDTQPPARQLAILLVEDNPTNRFVARRMLTRHGHAVSEAHDGDQAIRMAQARRFDLILMDVSMPVKDGIEATRDIRASTGPNKMTRIVALTAHIGDEIATALREAGMDSMAAKPLSSADLRRILAEADTAFSRPAENPATSSALPVLNADVLQQLTSGTMAGQMSGIVERFIADGDKLFLDQSARSTPPAAELAEDLHRLSGGAATLGARRLCHVLGLTEEAVRNDRPADYERRMKSCAVAWVETRSAIVDMATPERPRTQAAVGPAEFEQG